MPRLTVKGWYHDPDAPTRFSKGWAIMDRGLVLETGPSAMAMPKGPVVKGIVLPAMPNAHTHLADFMLREMVEPGMTVEELVAPPDGLKHRLLPKLDVEMSITRALNALKRAGTGYFCDFREGGINGVDDMARALVSGGRGITGTIMGRPKDLAFDRDEVDRLLEMCDGIGVSGMGDWDQGQMSDLVARVKDRDKAFALHVSEVTREDIDPVLDLVPDFVVHMTKGTPSDLHRLSILGIPVVACPRSNMFYGRVPPLRAMLDAEVDVCLGTDNAMMSDLSMFGELKSVRDLGLSSVEAWGLIESSWKLLNREDKMHTGTTGIGCILVEAVTEDPLEVLTNTGAGLVVKRPSEMG